MDRPVLAHWSKGLKTQAAFGHIQHGSAVVPLQLKEYEFVRDNSEFLATIQAYVPQVHVPQTHGICEAFQFSEQPSTVGDEGYRISGPRAGVGPCLLASRVPLYSYLTGLEEILTGMDAWGAAAPWAGRVRAICRQLLAVVLASELLLVLTDSSNCNCRPLTSAVRFLQFFCPAFAKIGRPFTSQPSSRRR